MFPYDLRAGLQGPEIGLKTVLSTPDSMSIPARLLREEVYTSAVYIHGLGFRVYFRTFLSSGELWPVIRTNGFDLIGLSTGLEGTCNQNKVSKPRAVFTRILLLMNHVE